MKKERYVEFPITIEHARQQAVLSAIVAVLAFTLFVLTWLWDQNLWIAAVTFPVGCAATLFSFLYGRLLRPMPAPEGEIGE